MIAYLKYLLPVVIMSRHSKCAGKRGGAICTKNDTFCRKIASGDGHVMPFKWLEPTARSRLDKLLSTDHTDAMPKRSSKKSAAPERSDAEQSVKEPVDNPTPADPPTADGKNPAAVALGRLGGKKGGEARAKKLTAKQRREIAKKAAAARWKKKRG